MILLSLLVFWAYGAPPRLPPTDTNKIYGIRWEVAFGVPFVVLCLLIVMAVSAFGQVPPPPIPAPSTNLTFRSFPVAEWELAVEYSADLAWTNVTSYAVSNTILLEDRTGFVRAVARMVPYPPSCPPAPIMTGISITAPDVVDSWRSIYLFCTAAFSDNTSKLLSPQWREDSTVATIDTNGLLVASEVLSNETVTVSAVYGGFSATHAVEVVP